MDLPTAYGSPPATGRIRVEPEDFRVEELLGFEPDGAGGHVLLEVEKRGANTSWVAAQLARAAGVHPRDVGHSGQKDRHAVTSQSFSLPWPASAPVDPCIAYSGEGYRVLAVNRHGRKLRPGSHRGNRFTIRVMDLFGDPSDIAARMLRLAEAGVPNYFGPQRFGREGANLERARDWAERGVPPRDRAQRGFALSAARGKIFNDVLAERVRRGDWNQLLPGEAVMLDGRRSFFHADAIDAALQERCQRLDVHPSGPLWGRKASPVEGEALAIEEAVVASEAALQALLEAAGLEHERRSLRLPVRGLQWQVGEGTLTMTFELPRGTFATAVLHEILRDAWDASEGGED